MDSLYGGLDDRTYLSSSLSQERERKRKRVFLGKTITKITNEEQRDATRNASIDDRFYFPVNRSTTLVFMKKKKKKTKKKNTSKQWQRIEKLYCYQ